MNFLEQILMGNDPVTLLAFLFFTIFGLILIKIIRYKMKRVSLAKANPPVYIDFSWKEWWYNNGIDFGIALMMSFAMFVFFPEALHFLNLPEVGEKMAYGFGLGLGFQYVLHFVFQKVNLKPHAHDENRGRDFPQEPKNGS